MEKLRKQLDDDPYGTLFGHRLDRLEKSWAWAPHGILKSFGWVSSTRPTTHEETETGHDITDGRSQSQERRRCTPESKVPREHISGAALQESNIAGTYDVEIDPITMRRTPKHRAAATAEEGVTTIPVKTYSGHISEQGKDKSSASFKVNSSGAARNSADDRPPLGKSSSLRAQDVQDAKARSRAILPSTNNLTDTPEAEAGKNDARRARDNRKLATTSDSTWLALEGFRSAKDRPADFNDRSGAQVFTQNLTQSQASITSSAPSEFSGKSPLPSKHNQDTNKEELDLLRPSDIRASAGIIKQPKSSAGLEQVVPRKSLERNLQASTHPLQRSLQEGVSTISTGNGASASQPSTISCAQNSSKDDDTDKRQRKGSQLAQEIRGIYEASYGVIDTNHRQAKVAPIQSRQSPTTKPPLIMTEQHKDDPSNDLGNPKAPDIEAHPNKATIVMSGSRTPGTTPISAKPNLDSVANKDLLEYEKKLGPNPYSFTTGQDGLEAGNVGQTKRTDSKMSFERSPVNAEERLRHRKGDNQSLDKETKEAKDVKHETKATLDDVTKAGEMGKSVLRESIDSIERPLANQAEYKVLAFDATKQEVVSASTMSSSSWKAQGTTEAILSPAEVMPRLHHPAKFLAYFGPLQAEGFEIVSGGGEVLVFKRMRSSTALPQAQQAGTANRTTAAPPESAKEPERRLHHHSFINPIDGTTIGNFASPTGFVNYDTIFHPLSFSASSLQEASAEPMVEDVKADNHIVSHAKSSSPYIANSSNKRVTRQERVFSGSGQQNPWSSEGVRSEEERSNQVRGDAKSNKVGRVVRRMMWVGAWMAGCTYLVGVIAEGLRG